MPNIARVVLHGVGEPMLVKDLPRMVRYLKDRGTYVLFNTNGTLLQPKKFPRTRSTPGSTNCACRSDAADRASPMPAVRGKDFFNRIVRDVGKFIAYQTRAGATNAARVALADRA